MPLAVPQFRRLFLHFFDLHFLEMKAVNDESWLVRRHIKYESRLATRLAVLAADEVLVPAASFCESPLCFDIVNEYSDIYHIGPVRLVGGGESLRAFIEDKRLQYPKPSPQFKSYKAHEKRLPVHPPFLSRKCSATEDITRGWLQILESDSLSRLVEGSTLQLPSGIEGRWARVPQCLAKKAFIVRHVEPLLFDNMNGGTVRNRLHAIINENYFGSFTREFASGVVAELKYLSATHAVPSFDRDFPYLDVQLHVQRCGLLQRIENATASELLRMKYEPEWQSCLSVAYTDYCRRVTARYQQVNQAVMVELSEVTIGVVTALPEEFAAVCEVLGAAEPIDIPGVGAGRKYAIARVKTHAGGEHVVAVGFCADMGNNSAAIRATQMLTHCKDIDIIMCGIAGAVPHPKKADDHVRLGDIAVSDRNGVIQYDLDKESPTEVEGRAPPRPPGAALVEAVRWLTSEEKRQYRPWEEYLDRAVANLGSLWHRPPDDADILEDSLDVSAPTPHPEDANRRPGRPRVFHGPIASANKLLKNPAKRDALRDKYKVKAVEMEGSGIADATWYQETGYLVVRGTCDYCNPAKGDAWHNYAALIAAAYTRAVIERLAPRGK